MSSRLWRHHLLWWRHGVVWRECWNAWSCHRNRWELRTMCSLWPRWAPLKSGLWRVYRKLLGVVVWAWLHPWIVEVATNVLWRGWHHVHAGHEAILWDRWHHGRHGMEMLWVAIHVVIHTSAPSGSLVLEPDLQSRKTRSYQKQKIIFQII